MATYQSPSKAPKRLSLFRQLFDQSGVTPEVQAWDFDGSGTEDDPYAVTWIDDDPRNPQQYSLATKWIITAIVSLSTLAVTLISSVYAGGRDGIIHEFRIGNEVFTLGVSMFVLGFALGPLLWAPLSEILGRQILYAFTFGALTALNAGAAASKNIETLIVLRFLAGAIGSSPLTNAVGVIADIFAAQDRGPAMALFAASPFLGPVLGPVIGGFIGETICWRWIEGIMAIFTGLLWLIGMATISETCAPVILRQRARRLTHLTTYHFQSRGDIDKGQPTFRQVFRAALLRPWVLLFREPIVLLLSLYMAIIYGSLYLLLNAFPIVYQQYRGWSPGIGSLAYLGIAIGSFLAIAYSLWDNVRYRKLSDQYGGFAPPEARLPVTMLGGILVPIGFFWFACKPSIIKTLPMSSA